MPGLSGEKMRISPPATSRVSERIGVWLHSCRGMSQWRGGRSRGIPGRLRWGVVSKRLDGWLHGEGECGAGESQGEPSGTGEAVASPGGGAWKPIGIGAKGGRGSKRGRPPAAAGATQAAAASADSGRNENKTGSDQRDSENRSLSLPTSEGE